MLCVRTEGEEALEDLEELLRGAALPVVVVVSHEEERHERRGEDREDGGAQGEEAEGQEAQAAAVLAVREWDGPGGGSRRFLGACACAAAVVPEEVDEVGRGEGEEEVLEHEEGREERAAHQSVALCEHVCVCVGIRVVRG